jgi:hypothetical protein
MERNPNMEWEVYKLVLKWWEEDKSICRIKDIHGALLENQF